jgi:quercetin dioxygenase-like cupin family protein
MKTLMFVVAAAAVLASGSAQAQAPAQPAGHVVFTPGEIKWGPAPDSVPTGAQAAVLYGDPAKEGAFAMRMKLPKGYRIPPHTHPKPEVVSVISGAVKLGMGPSGDAAKARALPAGSFFALQPDMVHYASADEESVIQLNGSGPWGINYVNPKDDPRTKAAP